MRNESMNTVSVNATGLPDRIGPHGVNLSEPRGVGRYQLHGANARMVAKLKAEVEADIVAERDELAKQQVNRKRASGPGKAGGQ
jgi:hypothetical protein